MRTIALILMIVGGGLMVFGAANAVQEFGALYAAVQDDPLGNPKVSEEERASRMLRGAIIGGVGVPVFAAGGVMLGVGMRRRRRRKMG